MVTPLYIKIALHYYCSTDDYPRLDATEAGREAAEAMCDAGLLARMEDAKPEFYATEGMKAWVEALCSVPMPEQRWIVPDVKEQK